MATSVTVNVNQVLVSLGDLRSRVAAKVDILNILGVLMMASVMRTFREEGSPAGSWPRLSPAYARRVSAGHKLLILIGRLRNSITYAVSGDALTVGTNLVYAAVHQYGSADRGAGEGPQARIAGRSVKVSAYDALRVQAFKRYGTDQRTGKDGNARNVRVREQGPANATRFQVGAHERFQNIPARPYLVVRPEDPDRFVSGIERYLSSGKTRVVTA